MHAAGGVVCFVLLLVITSITGVSGVHKPQSVYLSMDAGMWVEWGHFLENYGCLNSSDAVAGQSLLIEKRSFLDVKTPELSWLGEGDFTMSFWIKLPAYSGIAPWFTTEELGGASAVFSKRSPTGGLFVGVAEGKLLFVCSHTQDYDESLKKIRVPAGDSDRIINDNQWHHFVFIRKAFFYQVWLDGEVEFELEFGRPFEFANNRYARIGASTDGRQCLDASIDEMRFDPWAWDSQKVELEYRLRTTP